MKGSQDEDQDYQAGSSGRAMILRPWDWRLAHRGAADGQAIHGSAAVEGGDLFRQPVVAAATVRFRRFSHTRRRSLAFRELDELDEARARLVDAVDGEPVDAPKC